MLKNKANLMSDDKDIKNFIKSLKLDFSQEKFLLDELPNLDAEGRKELLDVLKNVYTLEEEKKNAIKKVRIAWTKQ